MSVPKYEQLIKDHPLALSRVTCGIYFGDGWNALISNLCDVVEQEIRRLTPELQDQVYVVQIKSKFGGLRVYCNSTTPFIDGAITLAENLSNNICETCGAYGSHRGINGWIATLCEGHYQKELENKSK